MLFFKTNICLLYKYRSDTGCVWDVVIFCRYPPEPMTQHSQIKAVFDQE